MNVLKNVTLLLALSGLIVMSSCEKEGPIGATGATGVSGPDAKTFEFDLTFDAGETFETYEGITGYDDKDVVLVYIHWDTYGGDKAWIQLPFMTSTIGINIYPEIMESGLVFINTVWADGTAGSPWGSPSTVSFRAVLIKSSAKMAHPEVNYSNLDEVLETFNLRD